jgi:hypothetical protein
VVCLEDDARIDTQGWYTTPQPTPDLTRDHDCYHYQAPSGQRCGSPALKGEYYCYHHHLKTKRHNSHFLIDPEVTRMEVPPIEDRASIFISLAAIVHRLAENTIDTRRAGQMIYALQVALRTLGPSNPRASSAPEPAPQPNPSPNPSPPPTPPAQPQAPPAHQMPRPRHN